MLINMHGCCSSHHGSYISNTNSKYCVSKTVYDFFPISFQFLVFKQKNKSTILLEQASMIVLVLHVVPASCSVFLSLHWNTKIYHSDFRFHGSVVLQRFWLLWSFSVFFPLLLCLSVSHTIFKSEKEKSKRKYFLRNSNWSMLLAVCTLYTILKPLTETLCRAQPFVQAVLCVNALGVWEQLRWEKERKRDYNIE